jgi:hypothetical protein
MNQPYKLPFLVVATLAAACGPSGGSSSTSTGGATGTGGSMGTGGSTSNSSSAGSGGNTPDGGGGAPTVPTVITSIPVDGAIDVAVNGNASAAFSEAMDPSTLTPTTFKLTAGAASTPVAGTVIYAGTTAVFWPAAHLMASDIFTATVTTGAHSAAGVGLAADFKWSFTTGTTTVAGLPVSLGKAGDYVMLAKTGISTVPSSAVTGDIGISPAAASFITGFSLSADATNVFSTSAQVTGKVYAADYAPPTPSNLTTAIGDMGLAFTDAAGRAPDFTELGAGNIGGMTLPAGVYKWGTGLLVPTDLTLTGSATDVWIFQIAQDLKLSSAVNVVLQGGALSRNVFWQVAGLVDVGTTAHCEGVILTQTAITLHTGASINGRLLAQTAINIDGNTVVHPSK